MKFRIVDDDDDSEGERMDASQHKRANGLRSAPSAAAAKPRFRAPSVDSFTDSSDDESKSHDDDDARSLGAALSSLDIALLTKKSRQELLEQVERTCEIKAVNAVNSSPAYQVLCDTLQKARAEAESKLKRVDATQHHDAVFQSMLQKNSEAENQSLRVLSQRRGRERSVLNEVEQELIRYQKELAEETRAQAEAREREETARQRLEEARQKKLQDEKDKQAALEAKQAAQKAKEAALEAAEARRKDEEKKAKEDADARQQQENEQKQKAIKAKQEADRAAKQYIQDAKARTERLDAIQEQSKRILDNLDPAVKQVRVDIRLKAGACNQISAAPSAIKSVVTKIQNLLQTAKVSGDAYFKYAMDMVATNLSKQARVVLDYKACYPVAHVIVMSCVHTPELTDVILANFHKMCVFTIPDNPSKKADQSVADYKRALGFENAIGDTSDKDGLEHVTVYTKRITMIVAVLAAVMQTTPYDGSPQPAGLSIGDCWVWIARLVNETPHLMTGSLLLTILEVAGFELLRHYKNQFHKLLVLIARDVCPRLSKDAKTGAANAAGQLEIFVSQYQANGCRLNEPDGRKLEETKLTAADEEKTDNDNGGGRGYNNFGGGGGRGRGRGRGGGRGGRGW